MSAPKESIPSRSEGPGGVLSLASAAPVAENSRQGFESPKIDSHPGWSEVNFKSATGIQVSLRPAGIGSRCQSLNRYAYALNNPTTLIDPLGLDATGCHKEFVGAGSGEGVWQVVCDGPDTVTVTANPSNGATPSPSPNPGVQAGGNGVETGGAGGSSTPPASTKPPVPPTTRTNVNCSQKQPVGAPVEPKPNFIQDTLTSEKNSSFLTFVYDSRTGGKLDPKNTVPSSGLTSRELDTFGNYEFGVVCASRGLSLTTCESGAGAYQIYSDAKNFFATGNLQRSGSGIPFYSFSYGDRTHDSLTITAGFAQFSYYGSCRE